MYLMFGLMQFSKYVLASDHRAVSVKDTLIAESSIVQPILAFRPRHIGIFYIFSVGTLVEKVTREYFFKIGVSWGKFIF